jgi:hypothetical protein
LLAETGGMFFFIISIHLFSTKVIIFLIDLFLFLSRKIRMLQISFLNC